MELFGYLGIDVWDKDTANPDDFLGRVVIPFREISTDPKSSKDTFYDLTRRSPKDNVRGQLHVRVELELDIGVVRTCLLLIFERFSVSYFPLGSGL